jgi:hypothetical protein
MPYRCRYCKGRYCSDHRLPENHQCEGLQRIRENPRWGDYASQVKRRRSPLPSASRRDKWDKEEESRGRFPLGGVRLPGSSSWYPSGKAEAARRNLVLILVACLIVTLSIRFLL